MSRAHGDAEGRLTGTEVTRRYRATSADGGRAAPLVIVGCTGNADSRGHRETARLAGQDAVWGKPFPSFTDGSMQREVARLLNSR